MPVIQEKNKKQIHIQTELYYCSLSYPIINEYLT